MEFENSFNVPLPPAEAWKVLLDIPRVAPCMPGAELTEVVDGSTYKGKVSVRLGPVALAFAGTVKFEEVDETNRKARAKAQGTDAKGRGGANATVEFHLEPAPEGSKVVVKTNLNLSGAVAQYGRGVGMIKDTAQHLIGQFADCLKAQLAASAPPGASGAAAQVPPAATAAKPIGGFSLMLKVLWGAILRLLGRRQ